MIHDSLLGSWMYVFSLCFCIRHLPSLKTALSKRPLLIRNMNFEGSPGGSDGKEYTCNAGDLGSIPGFGRSPGEGNGNPLHYSFLENPTDRGAWLATVHRVTKSQA